MKKGIANVLIGITGLAAGIIAGILLAPEKGSRTRRNLTKNVRKSGNDLARTMKEKIDDLKIEVNDMVDEIQRKLNEAELRMKARVKKADKKFNKSSKEIPVN